MVQTVSVASATSMAKPLKEQKVDKEKVWLIFILGAAGLFGGTLLLENNERFFPAIHRANLAISQAKKAAKVRLEKQTLLHCTYHQAHSESGTANKSAPHLLSADL